jgi:hypothetical protein
MKNRNLILSVLFWAVVTACMAITLPSSSYSGNYIDESSSRELKLGTGASFVGTPFLRTSNNIDVDASVCTEVGVPKDPVVCAPCCFDNVYKLCMEQTGNDVQACGPLNETCNKSCANGSSLPLGTPLLLLPFALGYAVVRRNRKETV